MSRFLNKPMRPVLNRADGLFRGLLFVAAPGWDRGFRSVDRYTRDDIYKSESQLTGSLAGPFTVVRDMGLVHSSGTSPDPTAWSAPAGRYNVTRGLSAFCLTRLEGSPNPRIFAKRLASQPTDAGWSIESTSGPAWRCEVSDGVTETTLVGPTIINTTTTYLVGFTYDRSTLTLFLNGAIETSTTTSIAVGNNTARVTLFGIEGSGSYFVGTVGMAAAWSRPLTPGEVRKLWTDPYRLLRGRLNKSFMFGT